MVKGVRRFDQDEAEEYPTGKRNLIRYQLTR